MSPATVEFGNNNLAKEENRPVETLRIRHDPDPQQESERTRSP